jgi:hypothetical protein
MATKAAFHESGTPAEGTTMSYELILDFGQDQGVNSEA